MFFIMFLASTSFFIVVLIHCSTSEDLLKTDVGDDVTFRCGAPSEAVTLVMWRRSDLRSGEYVFFHRDGNFFTNYQHPSYGGRVELRDPEMKDGDVSVVLKNVTINDAGTYECSVGSGGEPKLIRTIHLTVEPVEVKVKPGDDVSLHCQASRDAAIKLLVWRRLDRGDGNVFYYDGNPREKDQDQVYRGRVELEDPELKDGNASVVLKAVAISDTGRYECSVHTETTKRRKRSTEFKHVVSLKVEDESQNTEGRTSRTHYGLLVIVPFIVLIIILVVKHHNSVSGV